MKCQHCGGMTLRVGHLTEVQTVVISPVHASRPTVRRSTGLVGPTEYRPAEAIGGGSIRRTSRHAGLPASTRALVFRSAEARTCGKSRMSLPDHVWPLSPARRSRSDHTGAYPVDLPYFTPFKDWLQKPFSHELSILQPLLPLKKAYTRQ